MNWKDWMSPSTLISVGTILIGIGIWYATSQELRQEVEIHKTKLDALDTRLRIVESDMVSLKKDIEYIKTNVSDIKDDVRTLVKRSNFGR